MFLPTQLRWWSFCCSSKLRWGNFAVPTASVGNTKAFQLHLLNYVWFVIQLQADSDPSEITQSNFVELDIYSLKLWLFDEFITMTMLNKEVELHSQKMIASREEILLWGVTVMNRRLRTRSWLTVLQHCLGIINIIVDFGSSRNKPTLFE